jgi:3-hydroxybutyryl-CoA dehydrogenase
MKRFADAIKTVGVVGSGQMGSGIGYVFGRVSKHKVLIYDNSKQQLDKSFKYVNSLLDKEITKGLIKEEEKKEIISNFNFTDDFNSFKQANFVVEAIPENFELKQKLFKSLDEVTEKHVILASNTSSISITKLAAQTTRPDKVIGMHFMNPVPVMKLVEVIKGLQTSNNTYETTTEYLNK